MNAQKSKKIPEENMERIRKYLELRNYIHYYHVHGRFKGMTLKVINVLLKYLMSLKKADRLTLKAIKILANKLNLNNSRIKDSVLGQLYRKASYRAIMDKQPRKYIPYNLGIEGFFECLNNRDIEYVILRWFEDLPEWPEGEDIDILIKDEDIDKILDLFSKSPEGIPMDTYTLKGSRGCSFGPAGPYYPPSLGEKILQNKTLFKNKFYVPNPRYHFLSLIYHITYHKAEKSGIPIGETRGARYLERDHNYIEILNSFQQRDELGDNINLTELHNYLKTNNFNPRLDTLRKLYIIDHSEFLLEIANNEKDKGIEPHDLIVFIVREWAFKNDMVQLIIDNIADNNLDIISYYYLKNKDKKRVAKHIRGGNWSKGPYPSNGGYPQLIITAFDYHPKHLTFDAKSSHPFVTNENVFIKNKVRDIINNKKIFTRWANSLHSSDDFTEAKEYIDIISPELFKIISNRINERKNLYNTKDKVIETLDSNNTRSKTEVIRYDGELAVKKTYKKGRSRFLEREIYSYRYLSKSVPYIPSIISSDESSVVIPYYENILKGKTLEERNRILKKYKREIIEFLKMMYNEGYAIIDFNPGNIIITPENEVKIIDYEFLYKYEIKPESFYKSYDIAGVPKKFSGDLPKGVIPPGVTYKTTWRKILGELD